MGSRFLEPQVQRNGHMRNHGPLSHLREFGVAGAEYTATSGAGIQQKPNRMIHEQHVLLRSQDLGLMGSHDKRGILGRINGSEILIFFR